MNSSQNGLSDIVQDKQLQRKVPDNGHALLLLQTDAEERTYSDYPNLVHCLEGEYQSQLAYTLHILSLYSSD